MSDYNTLVSIAKKRRSIRLFKSDPVPDKSIETILEAARWAMSGANAQPWEFIAVRDPQTRARILELYLRHRKQADTFNRTLVRKLRHPVTGKLEAGFRSFTDAPLLIVVCGDPRTLLATSLAGYVIGAERRTFHMNLANVTTMIHLAAASLGLGSMWQSVSPIWEGPLKELLGIPEWFSVPQIVPIGYIGRTPSPAYRREVKEVLHYEKYDMTKFRSDDQVINYIAGLRKTLGGYQPPPKEGH